MEIFGPEEEILPFVYDMFHIIIGAVALVTINTIFLPCDAS